MTKPLLLAFAAGYIVGLSVGIIIHDWSMAAHAVEKAACRDGADTRAYMSRLPGESHSAERCVLMMRYGSPSWVPEMGHPLRPRQEGK